MKRRTIITILCTLLTASAFSQGLNTILGVSKDDNAQSESGSSRANSRTEEVDSAHKKGNGQINMNVDTRHFPNVSSYDYALYLNVTNQNGFWKGIGRPLTAAEARHLNCYFRLSHQVGHGRYAYMQALDARGNLTTAHNWRPYIKPNDDDVPFPWSWKLNTSCQWEVVYSNRGVVQQNAYNNEGNLIYQAIPTTVGERKVFWHYADAYGNVVTFRKNDDPVKGVYIELDKMGYDSIIALADANRHFVRNNAGAFISKNIHDREGNIICNMSCNPFGEPMIDDWGNCGWTATYDARGNNIQITYIDTEGHPMRMPTNKEEAESVITKKYTYDRYGRLISCSYFNQDMQPDTTANGIHLLRLTYDERGKKTSAANYRIDGVTLVNDASGWARWEERYDSNGNLIYSVIYDEDGKYTNNLSGGDCMHIYRFQGSKQVLREDYNTTNGNDTILNWRMVSTQLADTTWMYGSRTIEVETYDQRHRMVADAYYDFDMQPMESYGDWHRWQKTYVEDATSSRVTTIYYLPDNTEHVNINDGIEYTREVVETDSTTRTVTTSYYLGNRLVKREGAEYDPTFSYTTALISYDSMGMPARSNIPTYGNTGLFYRVVPLRNNQGDAFAWRCENEFGEPTYVQFGDWDNASRWVSRLGDDLLDEHNDSITSDHNPWEEVPKAFCIEVIDSTALSLGLRSGDILMRYGDWHYSEPSAEYHRYYENTLIYETVDKANVSKTVVVMRHNTEDGTSNLVSLTMPPGTPRQLGFQYHIIYMTERETLRYTQTVKRYAMTNELSRTNNCQEGEEKVWFFVPYKVGDASNISGYNNGLNENAVILAFVAYIGGKPYAITYNNRKIDMEKAASASNDSTVLYYTADGRTVKSFTMTEAPYNYGRRSYTSMIPDNAALRLLADSLLNTLPALPHDSTMRSPEDAMTDIYLLDDAEKKTIEGRVDWIKHIYDTGEIPPRGVDSNRRVWIEPDESSIADILATEDMLTYIDWTGYTCIPDSSGSFSYYMMNDSTATELYRLSDYSIEHFTGNLKVKFNLIVLNTQEEGYMHEQGLQGSYVLIALNGWKYGQDFNSYLSSMNAATYTATLAPITESANGYKIGRNITLSTTEGLGASISLQQVNYGLFREVLKRAKKR